MHFAIPMPHLQSCPQAFFPPSSFWSLTVSENGRGRPGSIHYVNDANFYSGRQRRGEGDFERVSCRCSFFWIETARESLKIVSLSTPLSSSSVYPGRDWHHSYVQYLKAFSLRFYILWAVKNWMVKTSVRLLYQCAFYQWSVVHAFTHCI